MKSICKSSKAFTVAEIMVVVMIIAIIAAATMGIQKSRTAYVTKFMSYAAMVNMETVVGDIIATGTSTGGSGGSGGGAADGTTWTKFNNWSNIISTFQTWHTADDLAVACQNTCGGDQTCLDANRCDDKDRDAQGFNGNFNIEHAKSCVTLSSSTICMEGNTSTGIWQEVYSNQSGCNSATYDSSYAGSVCWYSYTPDTTTPTTTCETLWRYDTDALAHAVDDYADYNSAYWFDLNCRGTEGNGDTCDGRASTAALISAEDRYQHDIDTSYQGYVDGRNFDYMTKLPPSSTPPSLSDNYQQEICTTSGGGGGTFGTSTGANSTAKILPKSLCDTFADKMNTLGAENCSAPALNDASNFASAIPNFSTTNGMKWFNLNSPFTNLSSKATQAEKDLDFASQVFTVYIDIDGAKGKSLLNSDILKFYITRDGKVLPAENSIAATNKNYLSSTVRYKASGKYNLPLKNVDYRTAACSGSGKSILVPLALTNYCSGATIDASTHGTCAAEYCEIYKNKPGF